MLAERRLSSDANERFLGVLDTLDDLCSVGRRGHNGSRLERVGLVGTTFLHFTARPVAGDAPNEIKKPDPQIHFHSVLINMATRDSDDTVGALYGSELFKRGMKIALGTLFRVEVGREMREAGFETYRPEKKNSRGQKEVQFELSAVPPSLLKEMSKRSQGT